MSLGNRIMDDFVVIVLYSFLNFLNVLYGSAVLGYFKNGVCVCVQDMRQTLFVVCFGERSCCFTAARCFSSRKGEAHPLYSGQRPWSDLHTYAQGRTTGVHRLDKGRSWKLSLKHRVQGHSRVRRWANS